MTQLLNESSYYFLVEYKSRVRRRNLCPSLYCQLPQVFWNLLEPQLQIITTSGPCQAPVPNPPQEHSFTNFRHLLRRIYRILHRLTFSRNELALCWKSFNKLFPHSGYDTPASLPRNGKPCYIVSTLSHYTWNSQSNVYE